MTSCSTWNTQSIREEPSTPYLTPEQISAILDSFNTVLKGKSLKPELKTPEEIEREKNLIPLDELYSKELKAIKVPKARLVSKEVIDSYAVKPEGVDLRSRDTSVKQQNGPLCTAWAGVAAMENIINKDKLLEGLDLSERDTFSKYNKYSCDAFIRALTLPSNKICNETYYPTAGSRSPECEKTKYANISNYRYLGQDTREIIRSLNEGNPVYIGMATPTDMVKCRSVINKFNGFSKGGHALSASGYIVDPKTKEPILIIKNSWSNTCGDKGYQYLPISTLDMPASNSAYWEIKEVNTNGEVIITPAPKTCVKWKRTWYTIGIGKKCIEWE
jgi:C1A family cysteine protease